jgi:hypothetical protein
MMPDLVQRNGELTPEGARVIAWIEAQFVEADATNDVGRLNGLSGYLSYYYVNVHKLHALTPAQWLGEHLHSGAAAAYRDMQYFEEVAREKAEQQAVVEAAKEVTEGVAGQLDALRHALDEALGRIATLEAEKAAKVGKGKKAVKVEEADAEPVAAVEPETDGEEKPAADETPDEPPAEDGEAVEDTDAPDKEA